MARDSIDCGLFTIARAEATIYSEDGRGWDPILLRLRYLQWILQLLSASELEKQVRMMVKRKRGPEDEQDPACRPRPCMPFMIDSASDKCVPGRFKDAIQSLLPTSYQPWITFYERQLTVGRLPSEEVEKVLALAYGVACPQVFLDLATVLKHFRDNPYNDQDSLIRQAVNIYNRAGVAAVHDELRKRYVALYLYHRHQQLIGEHKRRMELDRKSRKKNRNERAIQRAGGRALRSEIQTLPMRQTAFLRATTEMVAESMNYPIEEAQAKEEYERFKWNIECIRKEGEGMGKLCIRFAGTFICMCSPEERLAAFCIRRGSSILQCKGQSRFWPRQS